VNEAQSSQGDATLTRHNIRPVDGRTFTAMMEQLQEGYVASVAACAGCTMEPIPKDLYGFDVRLVRPGRRAGDEEVALNVQLKNTTTTQDQIATNRSSDTNCVSENTLSILQLPASMLRRCCLSWSRHLCRRTG
jgi:hypothetical protein